MLINKLSDLQNVKLPFSFMMTDELEFTIHRMAWFDKEDVSKDSEYVGTMIISDNVTNKKSDYTIWYDEDWLGYVVFPTYEVINGEDEVKSLFLDEIFR